MNIISQAIPAKKARTRDAQKIAYAYVVILTVLVLCQLFSYNDFLSLLGDFSLPGGELMAALLGGVLVASEVLALPFLLGLKMSSMMRYISMVLCWIVPAIWLYLSFWVNLSSTVISNVGFLGTVVVLTPGWWAVCISLAMGLLAVWASWGLWPGKRKK